MEEVVRFSGWANGGAAVGRTADGCVIFVKGVIPGETARVQCYEKKAHFTRGELISIESPSPKRIQPACPLFGICTGCQLQFLSLADQHEVKQTILMDQLRRLRAVDNAEALIQPMVSGGAEWGYRRLFRFLLSKEGELCFPTENRQEIVPVTNCPLFSEAMTKLIPTLHFEALDSIETVEIREGADENFQVILRGTADKPGLELETDEAVSVVFSGPTETSVMTGSSTLTQQIAGLNINASEDAFFYPEPAFLSSLTDRLLPLLPDLSRSTVWDVTCGTGFWTRWFSERCERVYGISVENSDNDDFIINNDDKENVSLYLGSAAEIMDGLKESCGLCLIEAGAAGVTDEVIAAVCRKTRGDILYFGFDPAIIARDAARIILKGRSLKTILPIDPAPQTASVAAFLVFENTIVEGEK